MLLSIPENDFSNEYEEFSNGNVFLLIRLLISVGDTEEKTKVMTELLDDSFQYRKNSHSFRQGKNTLKSAFDKFGKVSLWI